MFWSLVTVGNQIWFCAKVKSGASCRASFLSASPLVRLSSALRFSFTQQTDNRNQSKANRLCPIVQCLRSEAIVCFFFRSRPVFFFSPNLFVFPFRVPWFLFYLPEWEQSPYFFKTQFRHQHDTAKWVRHLTLFRQLHRWTKCCRTKLNKIRSVCLAVRAFTLFLENLPPEPAHHHGSWLH